ncbi:cache domain-containing protein [Chelatococcus sp. SYSU_G07232]|uniref:Cache domain-containing protein n=1 Tax=Chelatococcus albus TaxID=3047466 RepID=A0ABT7AHV1_9HYPH|nr:cache domain-containing protein [Chelatococcus sp. SYSU_G07232]MDJ1158952.1 cache domain-containing protein [Chelatococcus sp. SYSU_G07232]
MRRFLGGTAAAVALAVAVVLVLAFGGMLRLLEGAELEANAHDRAVQMKLVSGALASSFDQAAKFALALAETTARRADVAAALAAEDREALQRLSQGPYDYLKRQAGIQIYGYHSKDIRYLLRMHKPESFGDDIAGFRPMVVAANRTRRAQTGVEIGIAGIGLRGIAVVNHGGEMAGTMEVGLDMRPILDLVKASTNADIAVIVVPSLGGIALDDKTPRFGDLNLAMSTDDELFASLLKKSRIRPTRDIEIGEERIDGRAFSMVTQPLVDFSGRLVGLTIALKDDPRAASRRTHTELWVVALCGGILAFVVFSVLFQVALARRRGV